MIKVRIAQWRQLNMLYLPVYIAMESGLLQQRGIKASLIPVGNDNETYAEVSSGRAEFGVGDPSFCLQEDGRTEFLAKPFATIVQRAGLWGITQNPVIKTVSDLADLVGLRVGCYPEPSTSHALLAGLKAKHRRLLSAMKIVEAPIGQQCEIVLSGQADLALHVEPYVSLAESRDWRRVYSFARLHEPMTFSAMYVNADWAKTQRQVIADISVALESALQMIRADRQTATKITMKFFPDFPEAVVSRAISMQLKERIWPRRSLIKTSELSHLLSIRQLSGEKFKRSWRDGIMNI